MKSIKSFYLFIFCSFLFACNTKPQPFELGKDNCDYCKMGIADLKFGGEIITQKGKIYKFDDLQCMNAFIQSGQIDKNDIDKTLTIDFQQPNHFLDVHKAWFIQSDKINSPMGSHTAGYASKEKAASQVKDNEGTIYSWAELSQKLNN